MRRGVPREIFPKERNFLAVNQLIEEVVQGHGTIECESRNSVGFRYKHEARGFLDAMRERMEKFGLKLHPDKTSFLQFGRSAFSLRGENGTRKPKTFAFIDLIHIC